jgi:CDGSH-type Zn-finger protein
MTQPKIADTRPKKLAVEPGNYSWCACGQSQNQPFCDGSHRGSAFTPVRFTLAEGKEAFFCMCKRTKNPPYCDGTHKTLPPPDAPVA